MTRRLERRYIAATRGCALLALAIGIVLGAPRDAAAGLSIEPYVAFRHLNGDAGDLFEDGVARGVALSYGFPAVPLRVRGGIDYSQHDTVDPAAHSDLDGTVLTLDAVLDFGAGLAVPYVFAGIGVSNLEDDPVAAGAENAYDGGLSIGRAGLGFRVGLGRRLAAAAEASFARGGKGNALGSDTAGNLSYLDARLGAIVSF